MSHLLLPSRLGAAAFAALPSEVVVLDSRGVVMLVNEAWREFGRRNGAGAQCGIGADYLGVCDRAAARGDQLAGVAGDAVRAVLEGGAPHAELDYPCHSATAQRWFSMRVQPLLPSPTGAPRVLVVHDEITSRLRDSAVVHDPATHDPLTGLANRALLHARVEARVPRADRRRETAVAVLFVDVDHFRQIDDAHGHLAGDALLRELARRLARLGREHDTVARWGGDQFVLVLPGCGVAAAAEVERRLRAVIASPFELGTATVTVSVTTGLAVGRAGDPLKDLLAEADRSLVRNKRSRTRP